MPTNPGFHPDFDITLYPSEVRAAVRRISADFYVTRHFRSVGIGNSNYWAILVRPTEEFSVYVNTDRELLVLFATYDTFEIRTLEAYDEFYDLLESSRIDRSVRFMVSADPRIETTIRHYLDQYPEYPIIIPTTFARLADREGNPLLAAVRRNYLIRDLFGYQNPLREESFFFGRQQVVNSVLDLAKSGQNSSLFGLRKSGKTSAIYAIQRKARGFGCNVALIDCQNPSVHARRYSELLSFVVGEARRSAGQKAARPALGTDLPSVSDAFFMHMRTTIDNSKSPILLIFDEIENISPQTAASPHWRDDNDTIYFWQILRSFLQSESRGRLSVCIVGTSPHILEASKINGIDNPIYLYAQKRFIPSLTFDETREMVERLGYFMGLQFTPKSIAELHKDFGGHPFFTRQLCSKIHQMASPNRPLQVSDAAIGRAKAEFFGQLEGYLRDIITQLRSSYPEEFALLQSVVHGNREELSEFGLHAPELIDHLIGYGLIDKAGDDFDIKFEAIKIALTNMFPADASEEAWAEISRRRNAVEVNIRTSIFHWSRGLSPLEWSDVLSSSLTNKRLEALQSHEPAVLFSKANSPLYLMDLLMLLKREEVLPYLGERRSQVLSSIDIVNKLRKDAHAKEVSKEELISVRTAFECLEGEFTPP